jgi:ferritin
LKLSQELNDAFVEQVSREYYNSNLYKQIESRFEDMRLLNLAKVFKDQSIQEKEHGDKFVAYINSRTGGKVTINEIDIPNIPMETVENIADGFVSAEEQTTESIESIYELALSEKSYMDLGFIQEMLVEQVEEEDMATTFSANIKITKDLVLFDASFKED